MHIEDISLREVLSENFEKTFEIEIKTKKGSVRSIAPVNKNGIYRIHSLPIERAIQKFNDLKRQFTNNSFTNIHDVDDLLHSIDISVDFREIGGNLSFAISSAFLKAFAKMEDTPIYNIISKGTLEMPSPVFIVTNNKHTQTDFKEYMLYSIGQKKFSENVMKIINVTHQLKFNKHMTNEKVLGNIASITTKNALQMGINFGGSDMWNGRKYVYSTGENLPSQEQLYLIQEIARNYPIGYIEDPFHENDFVLFSTLTHRMTTRWVSGNELYANNFNRLKRGIELKATNAITVSPNLVGTITDLMKIVKEAKSHKISTVLSCNGDTTLIENLAVGLRFDSIKLEMNHPCRDIINGLIRIETKL